jgi:hypothetical protein
MSLRHQKPLAWSPRGAADTLDSTTSSPGSMAALTNLIPDPTTNNLWQCRPAAIQLIDLATAGFAGATFISAMIEIGTRVYGMVSTTRNPGQDEPFCYDIVANAIVPITGVTAANTPISPQQQGAWSPPHMELIGTKIIVSHPGFTGAGGAFFGVIETLNPNALTWQGTNTTGTPLISPPTWVANFNQRCHFLVNPPGQQPADYVSDELQPTVISDATHILTFGDNILLTCAIGLPLSNQLGGIIQSLMVFKGVTNIYQITGDFAFPTLGIASTLAINALNVATGTLSPNSLTTTNKGVAFLAPDGVRVIDFNARVSDPIGRAGEGVTDPFFFSLTPSRANASFNGGVFRAQVQNGAAPGSPQQEWWYDSVRSAWSGPHTTKVSMIVPYANTFIITIQGAGAKLFQSDQVQSNTSTYVENGVQLSWNFQTAFLPNTDLMAQNCIIESTVTAALVAGNSIVCTALDANSNVLDIVAIPAVGQATLWGHFNWGQALWQGQANALTPRSIAWHQPLVFQRLSLSFTGMSLAGVKLGRLNLRYQILGYLLEQDTGGVGRVPTVLGIGSFTLNPNATTTIVSAPCTVGSAIFWSPQTPDAANDMATTSVVANNGFFTVTHANNPRIDRTFSYEVVV